MITKSLNDCLILTIDKRGVTPKKLSSDWCSSGYRVLSANNVKTSGLKSLEDIRFVDKETYQKWMKEEIQRGDVLLTSEAPAGEVFYWDSDEKIVVGQRLFGLRTKNDVDPLYLKYFLQSTAGQAEISNKCSGSTVFGISAKMFDQIKVILPESISYQKRVSSFLYAIDKKIENNNKINAELESLAKTIYDYWFLQFEFPNEEGKPYKSSGGKMVWNEELKREIPEGWAYSLLKDKFSIKRGISYTSDDIKNNNGIPMLNLACIDTNRNYRDGELKFYSGKAKAEFLSSDDLIVASTDLTRNADIVGSPILVPQTGEKFIFSMDLVKLIPNEDIFDKYYLYMCLRTDFYHNYIKKWASGTNVLHLNLDGISWYKTWIPPKKIQNKFSNIIKKIHSKKGIILKENRELSSLREFLLPMLMNGQISFSEGK